MKPNEKANPVNVDFLSGKRKMMKANPLANLVSKRGFSRSSDILFIKTVRQSMRPNQIKIDDEPANDNMHCSKVILFCVC